MNLSPLTAFAMEGESVKDYYDPTFEKLLKKYQETMGIPVESMEEEEKTSEELFFESIPIIAPISSFRNKDANRMISRVEFVRILMEEVFPDAVQYSPCLETIDSDPTPPQEYSLLFTDVHKDSSYAQHLCIAMQAGFIQGYQDGSFRPHRPINLAEASKVLTKVFGIRYTVMQSSESDEQWFSPYVRALAERNAIPQSVETFSTPITYGETAEMVERIESGLFDRPSQSYSELQ